MGGWRAGRGRVRQGESATSRGLQGRVVQRRMRAVQCEGPAGTVPGRTSRRACAWAPPALIIPGAICLGGCSRGVNLAPGQWLVPRHSTSLPLVGCTDDAGRKTRAQAGHGCMAASVQGTHGTLGAVGRAPHLPACRPCKAPMQAHPHPVPVPKYRPEQITMSRGYPMPITYRGLPSGSPAVHCDTTLQAADRVQPWARCSGTLGGGGGWGAASTRTGGCTALRQARESAPCMQGPHNPSIRAHCTNELLSSPPARPPMA